MEYVILVMILMAFINLKTMAHETSHKTNQNFDPENNGKKGILMVHFGTVKKEVRKKTLESLNINVGKNFPEFQIKEAYTSRMIIKKIYEMEEIRKDTPKEALEKMAEEGFTHVMVQASHVINGIEAEHLKDEINEFKEKFKDIRLGDPLLTSSVDYIETAEVLKMGFGNIEGAVVFVGHGTRHHSNSAYGMMQNIFRMKGMDNFYVGTVEGYPALEDTIEELKKDDVKNVTLVPFMIVAGTHASDDISVVWKETLEKEGFNVNVVMKGIGEIPGIQHIFVHHIFDSLNYKEENVKSKKKAILKSIN